MLRCWSVLRRYSALKSLGEKKACFNEYQQQRKNEEVTEKRQRLKRAREDFTTMLEETPNLRSSTRYSMAASMLQDDPRWKVRAHVPYSQLEQLLHDRDPSGAWGMYNLMKVMHFSSIAATLVLIM